MFIPPSPKNEINNSSKNWAQKIRFRYVPALKGDNYFPHLLKDLHNTLAISIDEELKVASTKFVETLLQNTESMLEELDKRLNLGSKIRLPNDLSSLFEVLDFGTNHNGSRVSIDQRGDGIKIRHIPSILKFIHEEENRIRKRGSVKVNSIWGYEEPENNLELIAAFQKAGELLEISSDIQILLTTHSPAFYNLRNKNKSTLLYYTIQDPKGTSYSKIESDEEIEIADDRMGLLPLIAPYIEKNSCEHELNQTKQSVKQLLEKQTHNKDTIFVEGRTDKIIVEFFLNKVSEEEYDIAVKTDSSAGSAWVKNNLIAWAMNPEVERTNHKAYGMLDKDEAGSKAHEDFDKFINFSGRKAHQGKVKSSQLKAPVHLREIFKKKGFKLDIELEELFPPSVWQYAKEKKWLEPRILAACLDLSLITNDKSPKEIIEEAFPNEEQNIYLLYKVKDNNKENFAKYVASHNHDGSIFSGVELNIKQAIEFFNRGRP